MKIRLYLDEDAMDADLVHALRIRGVDVTTALEQAMIRRDDVDHLELAASQGRTLYSFNVGDFLRLHHEYLTGGKHHSGIILAQQQRHSLGDQMRRLLKIIASRSAEDIADTAVFLTAW
ncbi:MAG: DUF5615 family PIN-like protein [Acidobacteriota bacterium]